MNAEQFYDFCVQNKACDEGLEAIKGLSLDEFWNNAKIEPFLMDLRLKQAQLIRDIVGNPFERG
jgi:hypothetical protein